MSMNPLKVTAYLASQVAGDSIQLDSLLSYELAMRMGLAHKVTRDNPLDESADMPIPISKRKIDDIFVWCCSNPIYRTKTLEIVRYTKRFPSDDAIILKDNHKKSLLTASGPYKMQYRPLSIFGIDKIVWFAHGDKKEINKLLKKVTAIGRNRNMGFGKIEKFEIEVIDEDYSIQANKILMKTVPIEYTKNKELAGYRVSYGGYKPPYWHPDNYREIAVPC